MWVHFLEDDDRRVKRKPAGITTGVIRYKAGMVENVPRGYGEALIAEGKAEATESPARKDTDDGATSTAGPAASAEVDAKPRRRRGG